MKKLSTKLLLIGSLFVGISVSAWGVTGHRVVAEIAQNHLTKKSKKSLQKLIGKQSLAYWSNWPDFLKSHPDDAYKHTDSWHYVNVAPQTDFNAFENEIKALQKPNVYKQILLLSEEIKNKNTPIDKKIEALKFLIHLVGDMHQPLHVGRAEDLGGNRISVSFFGDKTNLHSLWDSKLVDFQKYSYQEFAKELDTKSKEEIAKIQAGNLENWVFESHLLASKIYESANPNDNLSYDYNYKFAAILEQQLYAGGLRLAKILNEIL